MNEDSLFVATGLPLPVAVARIVEVLGVELLTVPDDPSDAVFVFGESNVSLHEPTFEEPDGRDVSIHMLNRADRHRGATADAGRIYDLLAEHTDWGLALLPHDASDYTRTRTAAHASLP